MPRPATYDDALTSRLVQEAAKVIARDGVEVLSLRAVATAAGTSTNAIYTLFGSKAQLVEAVLAEAEHSFGEAQHSAPTSKDVLADLAALGRAYRTWALEHPSLYAVMFGGRVPFGPDERSTPSPTAEEPAEAVSTILPLTRVVDRAMAAGVMSGSSVEELVLSIWAAVHGFVSIELATDPGGLETAYENHLAAIARAWAPVSE